MLLTKSASLPISKGPEDRHSFPSRFVALYGPTRSQLSKQGFVILHAKNQGKPPAVQTTTVPGTTPPSHSGPRRSAAPAAALIQGTRRGAAFGRWDTRPNHASAGRPASTTGFSTSMVC